MVMAIGCPPTECNLPNGALTGDINTTTSNDPNFVPRIVFNDSLNPATVTPVARDSRGNTIAISTVLTANNTILEVRAQNGWPTGVSEIVLSGGVANTNGTCTMLQRTYPITVNLPCSAPNNVLAVTITPTTASNPNEVLTVAFNAPIQANTLQITAQAGTRVIPLQIVPLPDNMTFRINPLNTTWSNGQNTVTVNSGVKTIDNTCTLPQIVVTNIAFTLPCTAPGGSLTATLVSATPYTAFNTPTLIRFNAPVNPNLGTFELKNTAGTTIAHTRSWNTTNTEVTLTPVTNLSQGNNTLDITGVVSADGTCSITTQQITLPVVVPCSVGTLTATITQGNPLTAIRQPVTITFNAPINAPTITANVAGNTALTSPTTAVFTPSVDWVAGTNTLTIATATTIDGTCTLTNQQLTTTLGCLAPGGNLTVAGSPNPLPTTTTPLVLTFNAPIDTANSTFTLTGNPLTPVYTQNNTVVTLTPTNPWQQSNSVVVTTRTPDTLCTLTQTVTIPLAQCQTPLTATVTPTTATSLRQVFTVTFNQPVSTPTVQLRNGTGQILTTSMVLDNAGLLLSLTPTQDLSPGANTVRVVSATSRDGLCGLSNLDLPVNVPCLAPNGVMTAIVTPTSLPTNTTPIQIDFNVPVSQIEADQITVGTKAITAVRSQNNTRVTLTPNAGVTWDANNTIAYNDVVSLDGTCTLSGTATVALQPCPPPGLTMTMGGLPITSRQTSTVNFTFNRPINPATVTTELFTPQSLPIVHTATWDATNTILTIDPTPDWILGGNVFRFTGTSADGICSLTAQQEVIPVVCLAPGGNINPTVTPTSLTTTTTPIVFTFPSAIDIAQPPVFITRENTVTGTVIANTVVWSAGNTVATVTPTTGWTANVFWQVQARTPDQLCLLDTTGTVPRSNCQTVFIDPVVGPAQILETTPVTLTFNQPVDQAVLPTVTGAGAVAWTSPTVLTVQPPVGGWPTPNSAVGISGVVDPTGLCTYSGTVTVNRAVCTNPLTAVLSPVPVPTTQTPIVITFNQAIDPATPAIKATYTGDGQTAFSQVLSGGNTVLTLTPTGNNAWANNNTNVITVQAQDAVNGLCTLNQAFTLQMATCATPMQATTIPTTGAIDQLGINFVFNQPPTFVGSQGGITITDAANNPFTDFTIVITGNAVELRRTVAAWPTGNLTINFNERPRDVTGLCGYTNVHIVSMVECPAPGGNLSLLGNQFMDGRTPLTQFPQILELNFDANLDPATINATNVAVTHDNLTSTDFSLTLDPADNSKLMIQPTGGAFWRPGVIVQVVMANVNTAVGNCPFAQTIQTNAIIESNCPTGAFTTTVNVVNNATRSITASVPISQTSFKILVTSSTNPALPVGTFITNPTFPNNTTMQFTFDPNFNYVFQVYTVKSDLSCANFNLISVGSG